MSEWYLIGTKDGRPRNFKLLTREFAEQQAGRTGATIIPVNFGEPIQVERNRFGLVEQAIKRLQPIETSRYKGRFRQAWIPIAKLPAKLLAFVQAERGGPMKASPDPLRGQPIDDNVVYLTWDENEKWSATFGFVTEVSRSCGCGEMHKGFDKLLNLLSKEER